MFCVILAGGYGKRLRPITDEKPKVLIEVGGKPILEWQILWLKKYEISSFLILAGYRKEKLVEWVSKNSSRLDVNFAFIFEDEPLGTGGALKRAKNFLEREDKFLVINGDIITNINVSKLIEEDEKDFIIELSLVPLRSPYGIVKIDENSKVISFVEKPILKEYWINAGVYLMKPKIFEFLPDKGDLERLTFPILAEKGLIKGVKFPDSYWRSIDSHKDLEEASQEVIEIIK
ncbi:MAG: nucleotidyltransferase family protein [Sulfolobaceae archaeon]